MTVIQFEDSGKVKPPTAEALIAADAQSSVLAYTHGIFEDGRPYYAYIAVKPSMYAEFHRRTSAREVIVLGDYGTIVAAGFEASPPADVVRMMRDVYGFDEHYLDKLKQEVANQGKVFYEKKEQARLDNIVSMLKKQQNGG